MIERETELYRPVARFFEELGYQVRGEVRGCDVAAARGDDVVIVELKRAFNLELVFQGIERQKATGKVYLAVEDLRGPARRRYRKMLRLCRLLGLGLMTVKFARASTRASVEVLLDPAPYRPRLNLRLPGLLLEEMRKRSADYNVGGSVRQKVVTAYREEALRVAKQLKEHGPSPVKLLRATAPSPKAQSILRNNFYGWFERVERGVYQLTSSGRGALDVYANVLAP